MPLIINRASLQSRVVRNVVSGMTGGIRRVSGPDTTPLQGKGGKTRQILGIFNKAKGFLVGLGRFALGFRGFNLSALVDMFWAAAIALWNFNWNQTDKQLDETVKSQWITFAGQLGGFVGSNLGYFTCGFIPAATTFTFNEGLAVYLLKRVGEEYLDEMAGQVAGVVRGAVNSLAVTAFIHSYKNLRKLLKRPGSIARKLMGDKAVNEWGKEGGAPWSFGLKYEEAVDKIPNPYVKAFVEELGEEWFESCMEASYVIAQGVEDYMGANMVNNDTILGPERTIEVTPNRDVEDEKIVLVGDQKLIKNNLVHLMAQHKLLDGKDLGEITGQPQEDYVNATPQSERLVIQFYSVSTPPWSRTLGTKVKRASCAIPSLDRKKLDWEKIKLACGGANGYMGGKHLATARLDNGRQMQVYGATAKEAVDMVKSMATLSTAEILTINTSRREKEAKAVEQPDLIKNSTKMYAAYATLYVKKRDLNQGKLTINGKKQSERRYRIELWHKEKPFNVDQQIINMLTGKEVEF